MDSEAFKIQPTEEPDLQTRMEQKRAELLAACRVVAKHVAWIRDAHKRQQMEESVSLASVALFLQAEIEQLEQAE